MTRLDFELLPDGWGVLKSALSFQTAITGYSASLPEPRLARLAKNGTLTLQPGFIWDFGSYAIDTPAMVIASAAHDALYLMTDRGLIPWEYRKVADAGFRKLLEDHGTPFARRWWCWVAVRSYSKTLAFWRRKTSKATA